MIQLADYQSVQLAVHRVQRFCEKKARLVPGFQVIWKGLTLSLGPAGQSSFNAGKTHAMSAIRRAV
jgi:hypothetical protein